MTVELVPTNITGVISTEKRFKQQHERPARYADHLFAFIYVADRLAGTPISRISLPTGG